jgi:hypothetical protein
MIQTSRRWYERIRLDVDSSCRIIRWKLEVADRYAGEAVEGFESNVLAEGNAVEDCPNGGNSKLISVNCPSEAGVMQKERGERGESKGVTVIVINPEKVYKDPLFFVGNCEASISVIVRNSSIGSGAD